MVLKNGMYYIVVGQKETKSGAKWNNWLLSLAMVMK